MRILELNTFMDAEPGTNFVEMGLAFTHLDILDQEMNPNTNRPKYTVKPEFMAMRAKHRRNKSDEGNQAKLFK